MNPANLIPLDTILDNEDVLELEVYLVNLHKNQRGNQKRSYLYLAIDYINDPTKRYRACKLLLDNGVANRERIPLNHLLTVRASDANLRLLNLFIEHGADINETDALGRKPIMLAVKNEGFETAERLLELSVRREGNLDESVLRECARNTINIEMIKLLLEFGAKANDFTAVLQNPSTEILQIMYEIGCALACSRLWRECRAAEAASPSICKLVRQDIYELRWNVLEIILENDVHLREYTAFHIVPCILSVVHFQYLNSTRTLTKSLFQNQCEARLKVVVKHVAILMESRSCTNEYITYTTRRLIECDEFIKSLYDKYAEQLRVMKTLRVTRDSKVTYFDLLANTGKALTDCCDDEVVAVVSKEKFNNSFEDFTERFVRRIRVGVSQRTNRKEFEQFLYRTFKSKLPFEIVGYICSFLKMRHIREIRLRMLDERMIKV